MTIGLSIAGFVFGLIGTILSILNYINQRNYRFTDFKIKLKNEINETDIKAIEMKQILETIIQKKKAISIAAGAGGGGFEKFEKKCQNDKAEFINLANQLQVIKDQKITFKKIPQMISEVNSIKLRIGMILSTLLEQTKNIQIEIAEHKRNR